MLDGGPFEIAGDNRGVLCVHGFTGSPYAMTYLGESLGRRGMTVVAPTLPGHMTSPEDLDATTWRDWFRAVEECFDELKERCTHVAVVGQSLGALLALHLAASRPQEPVAIASLAAPLWLAPLPTAICRVTRRFPAVLNVLHTLPKLGGSDLADKRLRRRIPGYSVVPVRALCSLIEFIGLVRDQLPDVRVPLLVLHATEDHTAPYAGSHEIAERVSSRVVRHRALANSFHLVSLDLDREVVAAEVASFFETEFRRNGCAT